MGLLPRHVSKVQSLQFCGAELPVFPYHGQPWVKSGDLARALGYATDRAVSKIYSRHADEFSDSMTVVLKLSTTGVVPKLGTTGTQSNPVSTETRFFSLRGCHLVAMFAHTPVAKQFRRWVLDVLDVLGTGKYVFLDYKKWVSLTRHAGFYEGITFDAGCMMGKMNGRSPERMRIIMRVCELREKPMTHKAIAEETGLSTGAVAYILRRYHKELDAFTRQRITKKLS